MKLNKTFGRIATTLVATAMLASVAVVPAFAVTVNNGGIITDNTQPDAAITEISFDKQLLMPADVEIPDVEFTFSLSIPEGEVDETATDAAGTNKVAVSKGTSDFADATVSFSSDDESEDPLQNHTEYGTDALEGYKTVTKTVTFSNVPTFTDAGVYKYELTEETLSAEDTTAAVADFEQSTKTRAVYLFVEYVEGETNPVVTGAIISDTNSFANNASGKTDSVMNYYMLDGNPDEFDPSNPPEIVENDLTITKTVTGDMGNKSESFAFSITINSSDNADKTYNYTITSKTGTTTTGNVKSGTEIPNVSLTDGASIRITGLSASDTFTVTEDAAMANGSINDAGYTTKYHVTGGDEVDGNGVSVARSLATESDKPVSTTVAFTNNREAVSPTGLIMDIAPYVLLVVVAAAGCFVFLRKRRED